MKPIPRAIAWEAVASHVDNFYDISLYEIFHSSSKSPLFMQFSWESTTSTLINRSIQHLEKEIHMCMYVKRLKRALALQVFQPLVVTGPPLMPHTRSSTLSCHENLVLGQHEVSLSGIIHTWWKFWIERIFVAHFSETHLPWKWKWKSVNLFNVYLWNGVCVDQARRDVIIFHAWNQDVDWWQDLQVFCEERLSWTESSELHVYLIRDFIRFAQSHEKVIESEKVFMHENEEMVHTWNLDGRVLFQTRIIC